MNPSDVCTICGVARGRAPRESECSKPPGVHKWAPPETEQARALNLLAVMVDHLAAIRQDVHEIRLAIDEHRARGNR